MKKVHIVPGWAEGNWHFKQLVRGSNEFTLERQAEEADIIVAHSSGVYSLPAIKEGQAVVLIDPPHWPGRPLAYRILRNVLLDIPSQIKDFGLWFWLRLRLANFLYLAIEPWRHIKVWRSLRKTFMLSLEGEQSLFIWDNRDAYCGPQIKELVKQYGSMKLVEMLGLHESCWAHPQTYLDAIKRLTN